MLKFPYPALSIVPEKNYLDHICIRTFSVHAPDLLAMISNQAHQMSRWHNRSTPHNAISCNVATSIDFHEDPIAL